MQGSPSLTLVALLLGLRAMATVATVAGGGAGGLFIPRVLLGGLTGQLVGGGLGEATTLFPVVGVAAFLAAGYRTRWPWSAEDLEVTHGRRGGLSRPHGWQAG